MKGTLVVRGKHVIRPGSSDAASIHIRDGVIEAIKTSKTSIRISDPISVEHLTHYRKQSAASWEPT